MLPSLNAFSHYHPARASCHRTGKSSITSSRRFFGILGSSKGSSSAFPSSPSFPTRKAKSSAATAMPFFLGRPFFRRGRGGGRGGGQQQHVLPRATGEDAPSSSSSSPPPPPPPRPPPPPPSTLYANLQIIAPGAASPLGPSKTDSGGGVNFALWSSSASRVSLCLLDPRTRKPAREIPLARTEADGNVWAVTVLGLPLKGVGYAYKVDGPQPANTRNRWSPETLLLDPYAPLVDSRSRFGVRDAREAFVPLVGSSFVGTFDFEARDFDWGEFFCFHFPPLFFEFSTNSFPLSLLSLSLSLSLSFNYFLVMTNQLRGRRKREVHENTAREAHHLRGRRPPLYGRWRVQRRQRRRVPQRHVRRARGQGTLPGLPGRHCGGAAADLRVRRARVQVSSFSSFQKKCFPS